MARETKAKHRLIVGLYQNRVPLSDIYRMSGLTAGPVYKVLRRAGIQLRGRPVGFRLGLNSEQINEICNAYQNGKTCAVLAEEFSISTSSIARLVKAKGATRPPISKGRIVCVGMTFHDLTVIGPSRSRLLKHGRHRFWKCRCKCGNKVWVDSGNLGKNTKSCGCRRFLGNAKVHGLTGSVEHNAWLALRDRCRNPRLKQFRDYGGRGIRVCERWDGPQGFVNFLAGMGPRPSRSHSLDRVDVNGNYEPGNCRWATHKEQSRNRRNTYAIAFNGETLCLSEWEERFGLSRGTLSNLRRNGWDIAKVLAIGPSRGSAG